MENAVLLKYPDAETDINYALEPEQENYAVSEAQLMCCDLLHNPNDTVKIARRMCIKKYILNKGHPKISRGKPRAVPAIDVDFCDVELKSRFEPLTLLLSDMLSERMCDLHYYLNIHCVFYDIFCPNCLMHHDIFPECPTVSS